MALHFIGIGLGSVKDISIKGLETVKICRKIYLESYTSKLVSSTLDDLKEYYDKDIIIADRELVEKKAEETILRDALKEDTAFLVIGDIFSATTHVDLMQRAKKQGIKCTFTNNASVINSIGILGLEIYKYGKTVSIPFNNENVTSPIINMKRNKEIGLHTLFLLDLDPINDKFMTIKQGIEFLLRNGIKENQMIAGCAGLGADNPEIRVFKASEVPEFTLFPQCFVVPGELHFMEEEILDMWKA